MTLLFERQSGPTTIFDPDTSFMRAVELADGRILAIAHDASVGGLFGRFFDSTGAALGSFTLPGHAPISGLAALPNGGFALTYSGGSDIFLEFYDAAGVQAGATVPVDTTSNQQVNPEVAVLSSGRVVVTWTSFPPNGPDSDRAVAARIFEANGTPVGGQFLVNTTFPGDQQTPHIVALDDGGFAISWDDPAGDGRLQIFDADGNRVGGEIEAPELSLTLLSNGNFVAAGNSGARIYDPTGALVATIADPGVNLALTVMGAIDGGFVARIVNLGGAIDTIVYDNAGVQQGAAFALSNNDSPAFVLPLPSGGFAFIGVNELQVIRPDDGILDLALSQASVSEGTVLNSYVASVSQTLGALNGTYTFSVLADLLGGAFRVDGDRLILDAAGLLDFETATTVDITVRATDLNGVSFDEVIQLAVLDEAIEQPITGSNATPALGHGVSALAGGGHVVFLTAAQSGNGIPVSGQMFDETMNLTASFTVTSEPNFGAHKDFHAAALPGGGFVVVWDASQGDNFVSQGLLARVFDADGAPLSNVFLVNTPGGFGAIEPAVVAFGSGEFVIAWEDRSTDDIRAQRFSATGVEIGSEFTVNSTLAGEQIEVALQALDSGGFLATWNSPESGSDEIRGRLFNAAGAPLAADFLINTTTAGDQHDSAIVRLGSGDLLVTWASSPHGDFSGDGSIVGRLYDATGASIGGEIVLQALDGYDGGGRHRIVALPSGGFALAWTERDAAPDTDDGSVWVRLFDDDGIPTSAAFLVNTNVAGPQLLADLALLGTGELYVAWGEQTLFGTSARTFDLTGTRTAWPADDVLNGSPGPDSLRGGTGDDIYFVNHPGDVVIELAGEGFDTVNSSVSWTLNAGSEVEVLAAIDFEASDPLALTGNALVQTIVGNAGANVLNGGGGADTLQGQGGDDIYIVHSAAVTVIEGEGQGTDAIYASVSYALDDAWEVENLSTLDWNGTAAIDFTGNSLANYIIGNAGVNILDGKAGADILVGRQGNDIYIVDDAGDIVYENAGEGADSIYTSVSFALNDALEAENLSTLDWNSTAALALTGNNLANYMIGNAGANVLRGNGGNDIIEAKAGDDTIIGGSGADALFGGLGNDVYIVEDALDAIIENGGEGLDAVYASLSYALAEGSEVETLSTLDWNSTASINLTGNNLVNYMIGNAGVNILDGKGGADILAGRQGNDIYIVDNSAEIVYENVGEGADSIYTSASFALNDQLEVENLSTLDWNAVTAIDLTGNSLANWLIGNAGANVIDGKGGNDILEARTGADILAFTTALGGGNVDLILGFATGSDRIHLDDAVFTGLGLGALNANAFRAGASAQDADDRIVYNSATGQLLFDADGNGAGAAIQFATLQGAPALAASDFVVI